VRCGSSLPVGGPPCVLVGEITVVERRLAAFLAVLALWFGRLPAVLLLR
jgi:hypothetical protein